MKTVTFNVELLSDVVVSANAATTGGHKGLDYLPGSVFLGAAVAASTRGQTGFPAELFLSGRLRFLDAWPSIHGSQGFPIPLAFHQVKGEEWEGKAPFVPHGGEMPAGKQPKQWRAGCMTESGEIARISKLLRMKSAVDRTNRRSADGQLFSYEAIPAGTTYSLSVQADRQEDIDLVQQWFDGQTLHVGKSRSAEYGRVRLTRNTDGGMHYDAREDGARVHLFLASDLAFVRDGMPVLLPGPDDFCLPHDARLIPERTFVRGRSYSPWNSFFNCRMQERQVLAKGSVIVFHAPEPLGKDRLQDWQKQLSSGIGLYREEGLGQVWVNPPFLVSPPILNQAGNSRMVGTAASPPGSSLAAYLVGKSARREHSVAAFRTGLEWATDWLKIQNDIARQGQPVPSKTQWANVREMAVRFRDDFAGLQAALQELGRDLRRKVWLDSKIKKGGRPVCLLSEIQDKQDEPLFASALYHACVEVGRKLSAGKD